MKQSYTSKYNNQKTEYNGIIFDSKLEAKYYAHLLKLKMAGVIKEIERQPKFILQEGFRHPVTGKAIREISYIADFKVTHPNGEVEVVDVKGMQTDVFKLKAKWFVSKYQVPLYLVKARRGGFEKTMY